VQQALAPTIHPPADTDWSPAGAWVEIERAVVAGDDLAEVIDLDAHRARRADEVPAATYRRRRLGVVAGLAALVLGLVLTFGGGAADAGLVDPVAGTAVVEPGETLWDVAEATAPEGIATREWLDRIRDLNGFSGDAIPAWTVVLLPHG
jgi:FAD/FMN-containing dehydrogenase